ncbi:MAG: hypothetical protein JO306_00770, partial [Gemmatimonadetes bacterium]|nr:hypothetical protein [Gemmatimonadota bacterium]
VQVDAGTTPAFCAPPGEYALVVGYPVLTPEQIARVTVSAQNVTAAAGPPTPDRLPGAGAFSPTPFNAGASGAAMRDGGFEIALRVRERAELTPLIHRGGAPRFSIAPATAPSGVVLTLLRTK